MPAVYRVYCRAPGRRRRTAWSAPARPCSRNPATTMRRQRWSGTSFGSSLCKLQVLSLHVLSMLVHALSILGAILHSLISLLKSLGGTFFNDWLSFMSRLSRPQRPRGNACGAARGDAHGPDLHAAHAKKRKADVGAHDQLRRARLDNGRARLSLPASSSRYRSPVATDSRHRACGVADTGALSASAGGLPDQCLRF